MNSDTLVVEFIRGLSEVGKHSVRHFYLNEMSIKPCQGCEHCSTSAGHRCAIDDDMTQIYDAYKAADIIVWATPMYWDYLNAQTKTVQDRMEALACEGFSGKTFAVLLTYRYHVESATNMFKRIAPDFNIDLHIVTCRTRDLEAKRDIPISECPKELGEAYELGKILGAKKNRS